jgi:hypothetical protein
MDKKIEVFKKVLTNKGINIEANPYLKIVKHMETPCLYQFGENQVGICDENEYEDFVASLILRNFDEYHFSFSTIANIMKIDVSEVENYFLIHVLSNEDWIYKDEKKYYYVMSEGILKFIENKMSLGDFVKQSVCFFLDKDMFNHLFDFTIYMVDDYHIFDLTDVMLIGSWDEVKV